MGASISTSAVLGTYSLKSGGFNGSGASYFQGLVGKGHTSTKTTTNYYSSSRNTQAVFQYAISFSNIPSNAVITGLYMIANGHAESTSNSNEYMCVQLKSGSTELSAKYNFKSHGTSNGDETVTATTLPTTAQLSNLVVEMTLGYYGGAINGVTVYLEYTVPNEIYIKENGSWVEGSVKVKVNDAWHDVSKVFKKVNGSWVEQSDISAMFDPNALYIKG